MQGIKESNQSSVGRAASAAAQSLGITANFNSGQSALASSQATASQYVRFKDKYDQEKRIQCHVQATNKFPTKLGLIIERAPSNSAASSSESNQRLKTISNPKFMMPKAFTVGEVLAVLRTRLDLTREEGLVLFANEKYMLRPNTKLEDVYGRYKDEDGFLYLVYAEENIYG